MNDYSFSRSARMITAGVVLALASSFALVAMARPGHAGGPGGFGGLGFFGGRGPAIAAAKLNAALPLAAVPS